VRKVDDEDLTQFNLVKAFRRHIFVLIERLNNDYRQEFPHEPWWYTFKKPKARMLLKLAEFDQILAKVEKQYAKNEHLKIPEQMADG